MDLRVSNSRNMDSLPENLSVAFPSPDGSDISPCKSGSDGPSPSTPRKNKRKMTEPKKRHTDFSIKRFCPDSPRRDEVKEREAHNGVVPAREYPPDTPETSPSPESSSSGGASKPPHRGKGIPEASTPLDLTAMSPCPLNIPIVPMPLTVTPPVTPRGKGVVEHEQKVATNRVTTLSPSSKGLTDHSLHGILTRHQRIPTLPPPGFIPPPSPSSSDCTNPTPRKTSTTGAAPPLVIAADVSSAASSSGGGSSGRRQRKNYKNMTRERRVEANARERTRVHTISAAFESLRKAIPSYSYNQRLSKLAILKIACSYINALGDLTDKDYTPGEGDNPDFAQSVDRCTQTIQAEGRTKRRH